VDGDELSVNAKIRERDGNNLDLDEVSDVVRAFNPDNGWSNLAVSDDDVAYLTARDSGDCDSRIGYTWFVEQVDVKGGENWRERTQRGCPAWAVSLFWHVRGRIAPLHVPRFWQNAAFRRHGICAHSSVHVFGPEDDVWMTCTRYVELSLA